MHGSYVRLEAGGAGGLPFGSSVQSFFSSLHSLYMTLHVLSPSSVKACDSFPRGGSPWRLGSSIFMAAASFGHAFDAFVALCRSMCELFSLRVQEKKSGPSKYEIKRQKSLVTSQLVNNSAILALTAPPSSGTVHATVPPNSNPDLSPPIVLPPQSPCPTHPIPSSSHGSEPQHRGDSPSITHVFVEDWSEDEDPVDEELEYDSAEEVYAGGSKFFTSPVNMTPLVPIAPISEDPPSTVHSPASAQLTAIAAPTDALLHLVVSPVVAQATPGSFPARETPALVVSPAPATSAPVGPVNGAAPLATNVSAAEHPPSSWRNLFASNRNATTCPKLMHYSAFTETSGCDLVGDDLDAKCDF
ncbi:hypothetical protein NC652_038140 [Populus alba x Populus x berolinensis]|nr:hypothetical protein NC652_038140 [Populus alba x Populus x berolinensis]